MEKFTVEERNLLMQILNDLKLNPLDPNAANFVTLLQSAARKIDANTEKAKT